MTDPGYWERELIGGPGEEGRRYDVGGEAFTYRNGVLRQVGLYSDAQAQTRDAFGFKWKQRATYEASSLQRFSREWLVERYLGGDPDALERYIPAGARVLDAGCGSGYSAILLLGEHLNRVHYLGMDISEAVDVARDRFTEGGFRGEFLQADFTRLPFEGPTFDAVLAEGTLHHTDSTRGALLHLAGRLRAGGHFLFYVYRTKGPIREYTDDLVRDYLRPLGDEQAWQALRPLSRLGKALGELAVELEVPEDIPYLGIRAGKVDLQRFFYWNILKAFYRPDLGIEEMNNVNFDWFRPLNAHRQTAAEVETWCGEASLDIVHMDVQEAGITVVARRGEVAGRARE